MGSGGRRGALSTSASRSFSTALPSQISHFRSASALRAAVLALAAAETIRPLRVALAVLLVAFAVSIYQSFLYFVIVIFAADLISRLWPAERPPGKEAWRRLLWYGAIIAGGVALYALIEFVLLRWFGLHLAYVTQFVKTERLEAMGLSMLLASLVEMGEFYWRRRADLSCIIISTTAS